LSSRNAIVSLSISHRDELGTTKSFYANGTTDLRLVSTGLPMTGCGISTGIHEPTMNPSTSIRDRPDVPSTLILIVRVTEVA